MTKNEYKIKHWELAFHLIFKTKRFGVNNQLFSSFPSLWGVGLFHLWLRIILVFPVIASFRQMKKRLGASVGFIPEEEYRLLFSKRRKKSM